ncbi:TPA: hypothetical protein ACQJI2_000699 [Citrobacter freundii]
MTALNKQALRYGDNVLWFLSELAAYDASDIDGGEFDVYGEDRNGLEGCSTIDVTELAADAAKLIEAADKRIAELEARDKPKFVKCWSCKHDIEVLAIVDCDGYCPRCAAPIDLDDEPYAGIGVKGE